MNPRLRIIDASINRATEGLRVVEDFVRFVLDDAHLTRLAKSVRHDVADACLVWPAAELHAARETRHDVGTQITTASECQRLDATNVCAASFQRVKQSIRSLEEMCKVAEPQVAKPQAAGALESIRYRVYTLERCVTIATDSRQRLEQAQLCVLIDGRADETEFAELVHGLIIAGVGMIQLRDKQLDDAAVVDRARRLVELVKEASLGRPLEGNGDSQTTLAIINDRPDIAAAVHADGVHLGQTDIPVKEARGIVGPRRLVGVSTHSIAQARAAVVDGASYLGVGPTFPSQTKSFDTFAGLELLGHVASEISLPAYAIGGIRAENLGDVLATGIDHVAVSGAVARVANPTKAAGELLEILQAIKSKSPACADGS